MIIYIDKTIAEHGKQVGMTEREADLFSSLACAHREGDCFFCGDIESVDWLRQNFDRCKNGIYMEVSELGILINSVERMILVSYDEQPEIPEFITEPKVTVISVDEAIRWRIYRPSVFVGESLYDYQFYSLIAERYMYKKLGKSNRVRFYFDEECGGGAATYQTLEKCVKKPRLTLCVVDSDKKHGRTWRCKDFPAKGDTAKQLERAQNRLIADGYEKLFELYCLEDIHEAENLIPFSVLHALAINKSEMLAGIRYLEKLRNKGLTGGRYKVCTDALRYYDFKNGNNIAMLTEASDEDPKLKPVLKYWTCMAEIVEDDSAPCIKKEVLADAIEYLESITESGRRKACDVIPDAHIANDWDTIGKKLFAWGFALRPVCVTV